MWAYLVPAYTRYRRSKTDTDGRALFWRLISPLHVQDTRTPIIKGIQDVVLPDASSFLCKHKSPTECNGYRSRYLLLTANLLCACASGHVEVCACIPNTVVKGMHSVIGREERVLARGGIRGFADKQNTSSFWDRAFSLCNGTLWLPAATVAKVCRIQG